MVSSSNSSSSTAYLSSLFGLSGKTVLITGGTRGIGRGLSIALASAGASIILLARKPDDISVSSTVSEIGSLGQKSFVYACDLASRPDVLSIVPRVCKEDGHEVDIIIHCGGIQHRAPAEEFPDSAWDEVINVNLTAGFTLSREFAKYWFETSLKSAVSQPGHMKKIIFIASITSFTGSVQIPAYTSSKSAIAGLTKALSNEWTSKGINVNAIAPGYIATELTSALRERAEEDSPEKQKAKDLLSRVPAARWGIPEDLAGAVIHLSSRSSDFISGEIHVVDGGFCGR